MERVSGLIELNCILENGVLFQVKCVMGIRRELLYLLESKTVSPLPTPFFLPLGFEYKSVEGGCCWQFWLWLWLRVGVRVAGAPCLTCHCCSCNLCPLFSLILILWHWLGPRAWAAAAATVATAIGLGCGQSKHPLCSRLKQSWSQRVSGWGEARG